MRRQRVGASAVLLGLLLSSLSNANAPATSPTRIARTTISATPGQTVTATIVPFPTNVVSNGNHELRIPFTPLCSTSVTGSGLRETDDAQGMGDWEHGPDPTGAITRPVPVHTIRNLTLEAFPCNGSELLIPGPGFEGITQAIGTNDFNQPVRISPSEPTVAVGPTEIFSMGNSSVTVTDKSYPNTRTEVESYDFFQSGSNVIDPQCFYDARRGRFIALAMNTDLSCGAGFYLMISTTSSARGSWYRYEFDWTLDGPYPSGNWGDFEGLGVSADKIAMTARQWKLVPNPNNGDCGCHLPGPYKYEKISIIDAAAACAGQPVTRMDFWDLPAPAGGDSLDVYTIKAGRNLSADSTIHLLTVRAQGGSRVTYRKITGPPSAPILSDGDTIHVEPYGTVVDAPQAGCSYPVNPGTGCWTPEFFVRNGTLSIAWHFGMDFGNNNRQDAIRYLRLRTSDRTVLTDETFASPDHSYYYPSVVEDSVGTMFMGFGRSSATEYTAPWATGKRRSDASIEPACAPLHDSYACARGRWGDYTGISFDATASNDDSSSAWYAGQWVKSYVSPNTTFGTWTRQLKFTYGKIAGTVLADADGNAGTTGDRTPAPGITLTLKQGTTTIGTRTSDNAGAYSFGYLESGTYDCIMSASCVDTLDAIPGTGATSQTRVNATDIRVALTNSQTSSNNQFILVTDAVPPAATADLDIDSMDCPSASAVLGWTAAGDNGTTGTATAFDLRWSGSLITAANFGAAHQLQAPAPGPAGTHQTVNVSIGFNATKYFALKTTDSGCNTSPISNVIRVDGPPSPDGCMEQPLAGAGGLTVNTELRLPVPNPSGGTARVDYAISREHEGEAFEVAVFDVAGRRLKVLAQGRAHAGTQSVTIDGVGLTDSGRKSGVYFVRLTVGKKVISRGLVLVR